MAPQKSYDWKRFWCPRDGSINLIDSGYLADPDGPYGSYLNPALPPFEEISRLPCLALLGEPGIGKTSTMRAESGAIDAAVLAEGGRTLWLDLRAKAGVRAKGRMSTWTPSYKTQGPRSAPR